MRITILTEDDAVAYVLEQGVKPRDFPDVRMGPYRLRDEHGNSVDGLAVAVLTEADREAFCEARGLCYGPTGDP